MPDRPERTPARRAAPARAPLILAHRGASGEAPENTLAAFELALRQGADGVECDVRASADGVPVVIHDARLERTTTGRGRVDARTAKELQRLNAGAWFYRSHPQLTREGHGRVRIPQLAEVMSWVRQRGCLAYLELKRTRKAVPPFEQAILEIVHRAGLKSQVTLISFHLASLRRLRALDGEVALGLDCSRPLLGIRRALSVDAQVILPHATFASRRFMERAHRAGLQVVPWGAETPRAWQRLVARGADGLIGNRPAAMRIAAAVTQWRAARSAR